MTQLAREYERVQCKPCKGTGRLKRRPGITYRTMHDGRRKPNCPHCNGDGYTWQGKQKENGNHGD